MAECLIGLGSNLGDRTRQLEQACQLLCGHPQIDCVSCSSFHPTPPIGGPAGQDPFLNAALRVTTSLSPEQLLGAAREVERQMGRERRARWGPRAIDIDLLLYDQRVVETDELVLPHPRMAVRRFVLAPACEVASHMVHPSTGWNVARLLQRLDEPPRYVAIAGIDSQRTMNLAATAAQICGARLLLDPSPPDSASCVDPCEPASVGRELQILGARLEQLTAMQIAARAAPTQWFLSSYWLSQSLAVARAMPEGPARQELERAGVSAVRQAPLPQCVIFLAASAANVPGGRAEPGAPEASAGACASAADYARELACQAGLPHQGPILRVPAGDLPLALTELTAAIDAMRSMVQN